jgi:hypothetical protein
MKEFLDKFGLNEVLGYLFPGVIALCALLLWGVPPPSRLLGPELGRNNFVLGLLLLIFSYAIGLVVSMASVAGLKMADELGALSISGGNWPQYVSFAGSWLKLTFIRTIARTPGSPASPAKVAALLDIAQVLERLYGIDVMPLLTHPTAQLSILRAVASDRLKEKIATPLQEAETQRRRYMFALGVALSLTILGLSSVTRAAVDILAQIPPPLLSADAPWHGRSYTSWWLLAFLATGGCIISLFVWRQQRKVAIVLALCSAIFVAFAFYGVSEMETFFLMPRMAVVILAAIYISFAVYLRRIDSLTYELLVLFGISVLILLGLAMLALPLSWVDDLHTWCNTHAFPWWALASLGIAAFYISLTLRRVAAQCWQNELAHTLVIVRLFGHYF